MKKSNFWCLMAILWAVNAAIAIVRFFDINIEVHNKKGTLVKTLSRKGDKPTPQAIANAALSVLVCATYSTLYFLTRKSEKLADCDCGCLSSAEDEQDPHLIP